MSLQVALAGAQLQLKDLVCNASMLRHFLTVDEGGSFDELQTQLCSQPAGTLQEAERLFLSQLNFTKIFTVRVSDIKSAFPWLCIHLLPRCNDRELLVCRVCWVLSVYVCHVFRESD